MPPVGLEQVAPRAVGLHEFAGGQSETATSLVHGGEFGQFVVVVHEHVPDRQVRDVERHLVLERHEPEVI